MDEKGFTYLEVIISLAVLSILIFPVIGGFAQSGMNMRHSSVYYKGAINAQRLLLHVENMLSGQLDDELELDISDDFMSSYDTDLFSYRVTTTSISELGLNLDTEDEYTFETEYGYLFSNSYILAVEVFDNNAGLIKRYYKICTIS